MYELGSMLYYMAPFQNAIAIAVLGIYSYNRVRKTPALNELKVSIADPFVNHRRDRINIGDRPLHDYVPLYWATHTPMQYVVTMKDRRLFQDDLIFIVMKASDILAIHGVLTTDANAASYETSFYAGAGAVAYLDWQVIKTPNCYRREYKRKKCAEVLVPDYVPCDKFAEIAVRSQETGLRFRSTLARILIPASIPPISTHPEFYY